MNNKNYKLILDSSTKETLVGISKESDVISEKSWVSNNNESRTLLPNIKNIIETNNIEFDKSREHIPTYCHSCRRSNSCGNTSINCFS